MEAASSALDPVRQARAREYARQHRLLYVFDLALGLVYSLAWLLSGASLALRRYLETLTAVPVLVVALALAALWLPYAVLTFPLGLESGLLLPRRYGLSVQALGGWLADWAKSTLLSAAFGLALGLAVYFLLGAIPDLWWLAAGVGLLAVTVVLAQLGPVLLMPLFYKLTPLTDLSLAERLGRLAERAGVRLRGAYTIDLSSRTTAANAALIGLGRTRRVVLGDTLLAHFSPEEIETVFAHELGHHVHRDIPRLILFQSALTLGGLYLVDLFLRWGVGAFGFDSIADVADAPLLVVGLGAYAVVTSPLGNAFTRWVEAAADRYALTESGHPAAFASAMLRLADQNLAEYEPPRWVEILFYDHPALGRRVALAESYARAQPAGEPPGQEAA